MNEREFYRVILGLKEPWEVREVKLDPVGRKVEVEVVYKEETLWACPQSQSGSRSMIMESGVGVI